MSDDYAYMRESRRVVEYGVVLDCDANGCAELHNDRNLPFTSKTYQENPDWRPQIINGHKTRKVSRVVDYGAWLDEPPGSGSV